MFRFFRDWVRCCFFRGWDRASAYCERIVKPSGHYTKTTGYFDSCCYPDANPNSYSKPNANRDCLLYDAAPEYFKSLSVGPTGIILYAYETANSRPVIVAFANPYSVN